MTRQNMIDLVERYFFGVDHNDFGAIAETMAEDCLFTVETHNVNLRGKTAIEAMFDRLWAAHARVRHQDFSYVADADTGRIAARFTVINTHHDSSRTFKSNCNFFEIQDGKFSRISVYMAGENTLNADSM